MQYVIDVILALLLVYFTVRGFKRLFQNHVLSAGRFGSRHSADRCTWFTGVPVGRSTGGTSIRPYTRRYTKLAAMAADAGRSRTSSSVSSGGSMARTWTRTS